MKNIYYDDFRCCELKTKVKDVIEEKGFYWHSFDNTIFFFNEMYQDHGYINRSEVLKLKKINGVVYHLLNEKYEGEVVMAVYPAKRYIHAQNETLSLLMNEIMKSVYHLDSIGHYVSDYFMVSKYKGKALSNQQKNELQVSLNGMIRDDYPVKITYDKITDERSVNIGLFDCGINHDIHVPSLKFIQMVDILEIIQRGEDDFNIISTCGDQMLFTLDRYHEIIKEASTSLQCDPLFINSSIYHVLNKIKNM